MLSKRQFKSVFFLWKQSYWGLHEYRWVLLSQTPHLLAIKHFTATYMDINNKWHHQLCHNHNFMLVVYFVGWSKQCIICKFVHFMILSVCFTFTQKVLLLFVLLPILLICYIKPRLGSFEVLKYEIQSQMHEHSNVMGNYAYRVTLMAYDD